MNIIFLDIDGVVSTLRSHFAYETGKSLIQAWDPTCCKLVTNLCKFHYAKIVISSTWRFSEEITSFIKKYGFTEYMHKDWRTIRLRGELRGREIQEWINRHEGEISNYIILDDDSDMLRHQSPHFIQTNTDEGFGANDYIKCEKILKRRMTNDI